MCGATQAQNQIENGQQSFFGQVQQQAGQVFGNTSTVFNNLVKAFSPIVAAGPSQQGFSAGQVSNLNSQAITGAGQAYNAEKEALGGQEADQGGGKSVLPGGATVAQQTGLAENAGNLTSSELSNIQQADYAQGNKNYNAATSGLLGASGVFGAASGLNNSATGAGSAASTTANNIAQQSNSWAQSVAGALGAVAGGVASNPNWWSSSDSSAGPAESLGGLGTGVLGVTPQSQYAGPTNSILNSDVPAAAPSI